MSDIAKASPPCDASFVSDLSSSAQSQVSLAFGLIASAESPFDTSFVVVCFDTLQLIKTPQSSSHSQAGCIFQRHSHLRHTTLRQPHWAILALGNARPRKDHEVRRYGGDGMIVRSSRSLASAVGRA